MTADDINRLLNDSPFHQLMETEIHEVGDNHVVGRMPIRPHFFHSGGVLHGGVTYSLADSVVAILVLNRAGYDRKAVTIEGKLNYLSAVASGSEGWIWARAGLKHMGKTVAVADVDVSDDAGRLLSHGIFTYSVR